MTQPTMWLLVLETKLGQEDADRLAAFVDEHKDLKCNELIAEIN